MTIDSSTKATDSMTKNLDSGKIAIDSETEDGDISTKFFDNYTTANTVEPQIIYMWQDWFGEWHKGDEPPKKPICLICKKWSPWLTRIGYPSEHDGDWICMDCLDEMIALRMKEEGE